MKHSFLLIAQSFPLGAFVLASLFMWLDFFYKCQTFLKQVLRLELSDLNFDMMVSLFYATICSFGAWFFINQATIHLAAIMQGYKTDDNFKLITKALIISLSIVLILIPLIPFIWYIQESVVI